MVKARHCHTCGYPIKVTTAAACDHVGIRHKHTKDCVEAIIENINPIEKEKENA